MRTRFLVVVMLVGGCPLHRASTVEPADSAVARTRTPAFTYDATLGVGAADVTVRLCFAGPPAKALRPIVDEALANIEGLAIEGRNVALDAADGVIPLADMRAGECVRWRVDLRAMAGRERDRAISWVGDSVLVRQSMWLLWPQGARHAESTMTLHLPEGVSASVPWRLATGTRDAASATYTLDATVARWLGYNAFGRLDIDRFDRKGAQIEIVRLDQTIAADRAGVRRWITDAVDGAAMLYDTYPRDHLQVVVVPVDGGDGTIYFGAAARGGGAGVYLLLDKDAPADRLPGGWTTVHELLHHGMPFVRDAWMSEGFVSYYTEIVRTRQGHRGEAEGWLELWDAFERGKSSGRGMTLDKTSSRMHETFAYQRVYWGGAAIAFDLDVTLRQESGNKVGFDDAMKHLRECCGDAVFQYDADALLAILDAWYGTPVFTRIAREHLQASEFADIAGIYARLGITVRNGPGRSKMVVIAPDHPAAPIRAAIMAPR